MNPATRTKSALVTLTCMLSTPLLLMLVLLKSNLLLPSLVKSLMLELLLELMLLILFQFPSLLMLLTLISSLPFFWSLPRVVTSCLFKTLLSTPSPPLVVWTIKVNTTPSELITMVTSPLVKRRVFPLKSELFPILYNRKLWVSTFTLPVSTPSLSKTPMKSLTCKLKVKLPSKSECKISLVDPSLLDSIMSI